METCVADSHSPPGVLRLETGTEAADLARQIAAWRSSAQASLPSHIQKLCTIVRRSVVTGRLGALDRWCKRQGLAIGRRQLGPFRDFLITRLLDLQELEPDARARLRQQNLVGQDARQMSEDYRRGLERGEDLRCRDCRYFVAAPDDGDPNDTSCDKSCVALGTKGADRACLGYRRPRTNWAGRGASVQSEQ